jgi:hypothetical protein
MPSTPYRIVLVLLLLPLPLTGSAQVQSEAPASPPVVTIVASDSSLDLQDDVPSGWVTFRLENEGSQHHSFKLRKLPDGQTFADYQSGLLAPADSFEKAVVEGRIDTATYQREMRQAVPMWFGRVRTVGGITGLAPGRTAEITHKLDAGEYVLTCLFKTPEKRTHALLGVSDGLTVTEDSSGAAPPTADVTARLSRDAFEVDTTALSDEQVVEFRAEGVRAGKGSPFVGLFRLTEETDAAGVVAWMKTGIPLPAPVEWIGGPEPMPEGDTAYVRVGDLPPGRYAWITEKAPQTDGMVKTFTVE